MSLAASQLTLAACWFPFSDRFFSLILTPKLVEVIMELRSSASRFGAAE